jgi:hypothetical protein
MMANKTGFPLPSGSHNGGGERTVTVAYRLLPVSDHTDHAFVAATHMSGDC